MLLDPDAHIPERKTRCGDGLPDIRDALGEQDQNLFPCTLDMSLTGLQFHVFHVVPLFYRDIISPDQEFISVLLFKFEFVYLVGILLNKFLKLHLFNLRERFLCRQCAHHAFVLVFDKQFL